jgi:hypothetical protein
MPTITSSAKITAAVVAEAAISRLYTRRERDDALWWLEGWPS